jgi:hypothetical protein
MCQPHVETSFGVSLNKNLPITCRPNIGCLSGINQERSALPVLASAYSSNGRRIKAHLTEQNISGVRYMKCKESSIVLEGLAHD